MARTNTLSSVSSSSRALPTTRISTATEETARDKCLRLILMSYTSNWRFFTLGPRSPLHPVVDPARLMSRLPSPSASDPVQSLTSNHQQQTPARSDGSVEWKEISNNGRRDKGMIRFIHVRERNLIIMCMMDSTFSSAPTSPRILISHQDEKDILWWSRLTKFFFLFLCRFAPIALFVTHLSKMEFISLKFKGCFFIPQNGRQGARETKGK